MTRASTASRSGRSCRECRERPALGRDRRPPLVARAADRRRAPRPSRAPLGAAPSCAVSGGPDSVALMRLAAGGLRRPVASRRSITVCARSSPRPTPSPGGRGGSGSPIAILTWTAKRRPGCRRRPGRRATGSSRRSPRGRRDPLRPPTRGRPGRDGADAPRRRLRHLGPRRHAPGPAPRGVAHVRPLPALPRRGSSRPAGRRAAFVDDPANADPRFARARWRRLLGPLASEGSTARRLSPAARAPGPRGPGGKAPRGPVAGRTLAGSILDASCLLAEPDEIGLRVLLSSSARAGPGAPDASPAWKPPELLRAAPRAARLSATLAGRTCSRPRRPPHRRRPRARDAGVAERLTRNHEGQYCRGGAAFPWQGR